MAADELSHSPRKAFLAGVRVLLPVQLGVIPFGMVSGIAALSVGFSPFQAIAMGSIVYAGASQLVACQLIGGGAHATVVILSAFVVNLRFIMYSASLAPHFRTLSALWKGVLAYALTDQVYAVSIVRFEEHQNAPYKHWFYFGGAASMWITWNIATVLGVFVGAVIPESWSLDFVIPLMFMAIVAPAIKGAPSLVAALTAGITALALAPLPFNLSLFLGGLAGIVAGLVAEAHLR